jgi:proline racemase
VSGSIIAAPHYLRAPRPQGHYAAIFVPPNLPEADFAVLFLHNEGYSTMCGHAVIALGRNVVDHGLVAPVTPRTRV